MVCESRLQAIALAQSESVDVEPEARVLMHVGFDRIVAGSVAQVAAALRDPVRRADAGAVVGLVIRLVERAGSVAATISVVVASGPAGKIQSPSLADAADRIA